TFFQAQFPEQRLSFRNLGFAGDELNLRMRCENFGSPEDWLTRTKASIVFAFFGYNESFAGPAGLDKYKQDLAKFIKDTREHKTESTTPLQLVIFSPLAQENLHDSNLPDGGTNNPNLKLYSEASSEVARQAGVLY